MKREHTLPLVIRAIAAIAVIAAAALIGFGIGSSHPPAPVKAAPNSTSSIFFSSILRHWVIPCGVIPVLIGPPDGSHVLASDSESPYPDQ